MENVQAAIVNPSPVSAKVAAAEAPADAEGAPLPGAFLAMLSHQVKNLKGDLGLEAEATDAQVSGADADLAATDLTLPAQPAAIDLQLLIALPPALPPTVAPTVADTATSAVAPDADAALADAAAAAAAATDAAAVAAASAAITASAAAAVVVAPAAPAVVVTAAPMVAAAAIPAAVVTAAATPGSAQPAVAKLPLAANDATSQAPAASASPAGAARASTKDDAPVTGVSQTREPVHVGTTPNQAAGGELPRAGERTSSEGTNARENKSQGVPSLTFAQVMAPAASAPTAPAQLQVQAPVGGPGWGSEVGQKVVWMVNEKQQIAELHVNPPDLGPVDIKLTIDDHQTTAVFTSPHSSVREALESALPRLREVLAESGINLGNASVTADTPQDGSAFSQPPARNASSFRSGAHLDASAPMAPGAATAARGRGLVDLFA